MFFYKLYLYICKKKMSLLKKFLKENKITQKKAAAILGVTQAAISYLTQKESEESIEKIFKISEALNLKKYNFDKNGYEVFLKKIDLFDRIEADPNNYYEFLRFKSKVGNWELDFYISEQTDWILEIEWYGFKDEKKELTNSEFNHLQNFAIEERDKLKLEDIDWNNAEYEDRSC